MRKPLPTRPSRFLGHGSEFSDGHAESKHQNRHHPKESLAISPYVVRAIGARQSYRYFQSAERIDALRARELGLVHEAVEPEQLDAKVQEIVDALIQGGPLSQAAAKDLIRAVDNKPINDAVVEDTAQRIAGLRATPEAQDGLSAFLDKRQPGWLA